MNKKMKWRWGAVLVVGICLTNLLGVGMSYAWWRYTAIQDKPNVGASKCFSIELANQANEINLTNIYPVTDEEGRKLTPYTFTIKNTCSLSAKYTLNLEMLEGTTMNSKYMAVLVNNGDIKLLSSYDKATTVIDGSTESRTLDTGILQANSSKDYSIALWLDEDVTLADDAQNKTFKSKVVIDAVATETPMDKIIASVDATGKCPTINSDGTVNVSKVEATAGYICSAEDAYGTSYYYRGNVTNNYVKFADKYWRIIRINGDGSVRVIYDGTEAHANGESSSDRQLETDEFNYYWKRNNVKAGGDTRVYFENAGVGYMYGNADTVVEQNSSSSSFGFTNTSSYLIAKEYTYNESTKKFSLKDPISILGSEATSDYVGYYTFDNSLENYSSERLEKILGVKAGDTYATINYGIVQYGSSSKEIAQTNTNDSDMKIYLDTWYKNNILGTENEQYLIDNLFCNDRSFGNYNPGDGAGMSATNYRWNSSSAENTNLRCPQQNDAFTVNDTVYGNGALTYPIGLLTADEATLAGGTFAKNNTYYLYTGSNYWTMSPTRFDGSDAYVQKISSSGQVNSTTVSLPISVKPVLNISSKILDIGTGMSDDPYRIS
mgnify:CR=1 FL=1